MTVASAIQKLKANSSRWVHQNFPHKKAFAWQEGYGAFSVGVSQAADTIAYIDRQEEHHAKQDFSGEWAAFLKKHGIALPSG